MAIEIAYNPDNKFIYVMNRIGDEVSVINSSSNEVIKNITSVGENPVYIAYNPDNKFMYIINNNIFGYVTIINLLNGDIIEKVIIGINPKHIIYNPTNHKMYITKEGRSYGIIMMYTPRDG